jgi:hypothetical protein
MNTLVLFKSLEAKFGNEVAQNLVEFIDCRVKEEVSERTATKRDIADLKTELIKEMKTDKVELIKWMFIFWVGQVAVTITMIKLFAS